MSAITIDSDLIHYEVLGRGRPVILVHGWLGSWRYWVPTMQQLSTKYRTYALDLWGFGDSGRPANHYGLKDQVQLLYDFMEGLGITKAALVGHSFGAAVCLSFARKYADRAPRIVLISTPLELSTIDEKLSSRPAATGMLNAATSSITGVPMPNNTIPATPAASPAKTTVNAAASPDAPKVASIPAQPSSGVPTAAPAPTPPATPQVSSTSATIPRNPFRGLGDTPEEILANLRARNMTAAQPPAPSTNVPAAAPSSVPPPVAPITNTSTSTPATPAVATSAPVPAANAPAAVPAVIPATAQADVQPSTPPVPTLTTPITPSPVPPTATEPSVQSVPTVQSAQPAQSTQPAQSVAPVSEPVVPKSPGPTLPSMIGTLAGHDQMPLAVSRTEGPSQLLTVLTSNSPAALLTKYIDRDSPDFDKLKVEVEKTDEQALIKSAQSFTHLNLLSELLLLTSPTLLLHGENDKFLRPPTEETLRLFDSGKMLTNVDGRQLKHFPMLEITAKFNRLLMDFLEAPDPTSVQFKEQWRRTMR